MSDKLLLEKALALLEWAAKDFDKNKISNDNWRQEYQEFLHYDVPYKHTDTNANTFDELVERARKDGLALLGFDITTQNTSVECLACRGDSKMVAVCTHGQPDQSGGN